MKDTGPITRDNHFLAQWYLRNWSPDGVNIYAYRILVSHQTVPEWDLRRIRGTAYMTDLYTQFATDGQEADEFERWIAREVEEPAYEVVQKVIRADNLRQSDWEKLARFLAAQDLRTPASFLDSMARWERTLPEVIESTLRQESQN